MTNLNTTPNPFGKHSFRDNAVDSAASQTYEFDIDGSVAASVENTATAKPKFGRRSFLTGFAGAALACMLAFGVQGAIIDPATAEATGTPSATQTVINTNDDATLAEAVAARCLPSVVRGDLRRCGRPAPGLGYRLGRRDDRGRLPHHQQPRGRRRQRL
ncbi:MAG: hypothetical protein ACLTDR_13925 [Adlercreutzia equolifaciens]